jgi:hypothetical protein
VVAGFSGSSVWHACFAFPPTSQDFIQKGFDDFGKRFLPILDVFDELEVNFALEVHPTEIAFERGGTRWLRFQEKRGKDRDVSVHSKAKEAVDLWLERSYLASKPSAPLFPSFGKNRETIESRRLDRRSVLKLVEKRARTSGILKRVVVTASERRALPNT